MGSEVIEEEDAEERVQILADAAALKKEAAYYNSPEAPVHVDPTAFGKNFFMADSDSEVDEKEREQILAKPPCLRNLQLTINILKSKLILQMQHCLDVITSIGLIL